MTVSARGALKWLMLGVCVLLLIHVLGLISRFAFGYDYLLGLIPLFNFEHEGNIPTLFEVILMLIAAFVSALVHATSKPGMVPNRAYWLGLTLIFAYMAFDEGAQIHEMTMQVSRRFFDAKGILYYAWVIPFGVLALAIGVIYLKFLRALPMRTAALFLAGGTLFLGGAIGMELLEAPINQAGGYQNLQYMVLVTIEEFMEMTGVAVYIYGVLDYMASRQHSIAVTILR